MKKTPVCVGFVGDEILSKYVRIIRSKILSGQLDRKVRVDVTDPFRLGAVQLPGSDCSIVAMRLRWEKRRCVQVLEAYG